MTSRSIMRRIEKLEQQAKMIETNRVKPEVLKECIGFLCRNYVDEGGYPDVYDYKTIPGYLVIASSNWDRTRPELTIYEMKEIRRWIKEAEAMVSGSDEYEDVYDVLSEIDRPTPIR